MKERKGIGYIVEALAAMLVLFVFVIGNAPQEPATNWNGFQREIVSQDLTYTLKKTGDIGDVIRNGETGTLQTMAGALTDEQVKISGTVSNVPISTQVVGFHTLKSDRYNFSIDSVDAVSDNECYQNNDLEEIEPNDGNIMRSMDSRDSTYIYIADTDPDISGGNGDLDYDSLWIDNGTRCQFSASEGPYYLNEFFYWGNSTGEDHFDINNIYTPEEEVELFIANQVIDLKPVMKSRVNGIDTGIVLDTMAADRGKLSSYDILVFRGREVLNTDTSILNAYRSEIQDFLAQGSILLMADLEKQDFYEGGSLEDNFITSTGLKWVSLDYNPKPGDPAGAHFSNTGEADKLKNYFFGMKGDSSQIDLGPSGNISSSNGAYFKDSPPLVSTGSGRYNTSRWNATNYTMDQVDPDTITGHPDSACVGDSKSSSLTRGEFKFRNYKQDRKDEYHVISTQLGEESSFCKDNYVRALNIDRDGDQDYGEVREGPFLEGEKVVIQNKVYTVSFPSSKALENGKAAELVYVGDDAIESVNYRTSFPNFKGRRLARIGYKQSYNSEERKMITSIIHWLSRDSKQFGQQGGAGTTTEIVGGVKENTFIPYRINIRWEQR